MSYYHYTKGCHLGSIVKESMIRTTDEGIEKKEKPAAWLTKSPVWESECNVGKVVCQREVLDRNIYGDYETKIVTESNEHMRKNVGMCRILISEKLPTITWAKFKHVSRISKRMYNSLDNTCRRNGSPVDKWLCTFNAIPEKYWEGIEMYVDDQWVRWDEKMPIQEFINLCLSSNGKQSIVEPKTCRFTKKHIKTQLNFIEKHSNEITEIWEDNRCKNGYVIVVVPSDYNSYTLGYRITRKPIQKSIFKAFWKSETENFAFVRFEWGATLTHCYLALPY